MSQPTDPYDSLIAQEKHDLSGREYEVRKNGDILDPGELFYVKFIQQKSNVQPGLIVRQGDYSTTPSITHA